MFSSLPNSWGCWRDGLVMKGILPEKNCQYFFCKSCGISIPQTHRWSGGDVGLLCNLYIIWFFMENKNWKRCSILLSRSQVVQVHRQNLTGRFQMRKKVLSISMTIKYVLKVCSLFEFESYQKMTGRSYYWWYRCTTFLLCCMLYFEGSRPEWCISSMIYSRDTPFWSGTLDLFLYLLPIFWYEVFYSLALNL